MNAIVDPSQFVYQPAKRKSVGLMIMLAGGSGTGKTLSALRLARGLAGDGIIAFCDTENDRALYYADRFSFSHLSMAEPFRPSKFEAAAVAAQQQNAVVFIVDSFSHEHVGPGGVLDFHEEEMTRLVARQKDQAERYRGGDFNEAEARERMKAAAWIAPKGEHKHMLQRLWQLNTHIILCCQAEKKIALVKNDKKKTDWVDQGFQPICGADIPYAMTMSFMLHVEKPGVPLVIKPLLEDLKPLIPLDQPIDEALGARLAAWSRGEAAQSGQQSPALPPPAQTPRQSKRQVPEAEIEAGAQRLADAFLGAGDRAAHLALVDDKDNRRQIEWLKKNRPELHRQVDAALRASWQRTAAETAEQPAQSGMDV